MVGDIVELIEGMEIPADGIVLEASELSTDESAMTGETGRVLIFVLLFISINTKKTLFIKTYFQNA